MRTALIWSRRSLLALVGGLFIAWLLAEGAQWLLRWRAERLLADIQALPMGGSWSDSQRLMRTWSRWSRPYGDCAAEECNYRIDMTHLLPRPLAGYPDEGVKNWLPRAVNRLGLREGRVLAGFSVEHGLVTRRWFAEEVALPVRTWHEPSGSYMPELAVSSEECFKFLPSEHPSLRHPYRSVRDWMVGLRVSFTPEEDPYERTALMDFRLSCITRFHPCMSESDLLPEGWRILQEQENSDQ